MSTHRLDVRALVGDLEKERLRRGISWTQIAAEVDAPTSTMSRLRRPPAPGKENGCDVHTYLSLIVWLTGEELPYIKPNAAFVATGLSSASS